MKTEHRTQIYLSEAEYLRAIRYARQHAESLAALVRQALDEFLSRQERSVRRGGADPMDRFAGLWSGEGGPTDLAERHDDYLVEAYEPGRRGKKRRPT